MDAHRPSPRGARVAVAVSVSLAVMATVSAFLLAVLVPGSTDPAAWGSSPSVAFAVLALLGFLAAAVAALLAGRLLARVAGRPHESPDAIVLALVTVFGAAAIAVWAFGVGIGLDPAPQWLNVVLAGAVAVVLLGLLLAAALIRDRVRRGSPARG